MKGLLTMKRMTRSLCTLFVLLASTSFWSEELGAIDEKHAKVRQMGYYLDSKHKDYANADGSMTADQKHAYMKKLEADLISPAEVAMWKRGASNAGYHYLGCAKTFARMGQAFAEANLAMRNAPIEGGLGWWRDTEYATTKDKDD